MSKTNSEQAAGSQRLSRERLEAWEQLGLGIFLHFGMSTWDGEELSPGTEPATTYAPDELDVDSWIKLAAQAGAKYAVLTSKHVSGFCLWPSAHTDYHVGNSGNQTDVVAEFCAACERHGLMAGLYYCSWDNHHTFGSLTPSMTAWDDAFTSAEYHEFQYAQLQELAKRYPGVGEWWIDIPKVLPRHFRDRIYGMLAEATPDAVIVTNSGIGNGTQFSVARSWPTDIITIERYLPPSMDGHKKLREIEGKSYYLPGEVCDPAGREWFFKPGDTPRSDEELLGMYLVSRARGANLLLDVGPDTRGLIPDAFATSLRRLGENIRKIEG
ncbi:MAG: alpha-L-fucosidase [Spirochaetales bacterium]